MASLRQRRVPCIRAALSATWAGATGFRKRQRSTRHHLQVAHRKDLLDLAEAIWRELLDLDDNSEDTPGSSLAGRFPGAGTRGPKPLATAKPCSLTVPAAGAPATATLEASDVDMQTEGETLPEPGGHLHSRARALRPLPRLGGERDKGPKLSLSKRKLELLLVEPEKNKRKKYYVA